MLNRSFITILGWALFGYVAYSVAGAPGGSSVYNPFEILGLSEVRPTAHSGISQSLTLNLIVERQRKGNQVMVQEIVKTIVCSTVPSYATVVGI
jgi:preprotein translocase subunit Sec63